MPNHITNKVELSGGAEAIASLNAQCLNQEGKFDFDGVIPKPECLSEFQPHMGIVSRAKMAMGAVKFDHEILGGALANLEASNLLRDCQAPIDPKDVPGLLRAINNINECGYAYWYDWACEAWGTKWNAYSHSDDGMSFDTAWSHPIKVFLALSKLHPAVTITVRYADEDTGSNCGTVVYKAGELISEELAPRWDSLSGKEKEYWARFALSITDPDNVEDGLKELFEDDD